MDEEVELDNMVMFPATKESEERSTWSTLQPINKLSRYDPPQAVIEEDVEG